MAYKFDQDTALRDLGGRRFAAEISPDWNIAAPHGGYLMAIAAGALARTFASESPLSLTAYFHRPAAPGPAEIAVQEIAASSHLRSATASLVQDGKRLITFIGVFSAGQPVQGLSFVRRKGDEVPPLSECSEVTGVQLPFFDQVRLFLPRAQQDWINGDLTDETVFTGYFGFVDGRPMDWLATFLFVDATPPPILRHTGPLSWVPTMEFTAQIRGVPTGERVKFLAQTNYATNGLVETDLELWTESGDIVALARQLAVMKGSPPG